MIRPSWGHGDAFSEQPRGILCMQLMLSVSTQHAPSYLTTCPPSLSDYSINSAGEEGLLSTHASYPPTPSTSPSLFRAHSALAGRWTFTRISGVWDRAAWPFMGMAECVNFRASRAIDDVCDPSHSGIKSEGWPTCLYLYSRKQRPRKVEWFVLHTWVWNSLIQPHIHYGGYARPSDHWRAQNESHLVPNFA